MSNIAIKVQGLGKQYRIGARQASYATLRESMVQALSTPLKRLRRNGNSEENTIWALKEVSFEVRSGEVIGIIGRNGAGKSTLLKVLSRITEPTSGEVDIYGRVGSLLEVGTGFHPELTGRENIFLNGAILGMRKAEIARKFDEIVAFAEIEKFIDTPVKHYSSGMYVRLAFAVAAHLEPEILLIDEVLAVGDAQFQKKCLGKMGEASRQGRTILFVSHNMTALKSLCSRAVWLDNGSIIATGDASQVAADYLKKGATSILKQEWWNPEIAPGNEKVRIQAARILPLSEDPNGQITVETPLQIEFEVWNDMPDALLNLTMHLFTIEGTYVFAAVSDAKPRPRGLVREAVRIPPQLLNDGVYSVSIQVVQDISNTVYLHPEILIFEVHDSARRVSWFGKWPGVIRPSLEWISENVTTNEEPY